MLIDGVNNVMMVIMMLMMMTNDHDDGYSNMVIMIANICCKHRIRISA